MENNKTAIWIIAVIIIIIIISIFVYSNSSSPTPVPPVTGTATSTIPTTATVPVAIQSFAFNPATITVNVGDTVVWTNQDSVAHNVTGTNWQSDLLTTGQSYVHTFTTAGTFDYLCTIHPMMKGQVVVK